MRIHPVGKRGVSMDLRFLRLRVFRALALRRATRPIIFQRASLWVDRGAARREAGDISERRCAGLGRSGAGRERDRCRPSSTRSVSPIRRTYNRVSGIDCTHCSGPRPAPSVIAPRELRCASSSSIVSKGFGGRVDGRDVATGIESRL
jgi:hypothetical protein